jgi:hypothetical protein
MPTKAAALYKVAWYLNEPNVNAIIVHDGVLLEDGMRAVMS